MSAKGVDQCENDRRAALHRAAQRRYAASAKGKSREQRYADTAKNNKARYMAHKGKATGRRLVLLQKYGLTPRQYDIMFALQDGKCVGCGRPPKTRRLAVEHDHKTKRVRGLACHNCNRHLIGKNTVETARWLVAYLSSEFDGRTL